MRFLITIPLLFTLFEGLGFASVNPWEAGKSAIDYELSCSSGGSTIPTPFDLDHINQKFELADGELYDLSGVVELLPSFDNESGIVSYLRVDSSHYTWLAKVDHESASYYPLEGPESFWRSHAHQSIRLLSRAHGRIARVKHRASQYESTQEQYRYVISLEPLCQLDQTDRRD